MSSVIVMTKDRVDQITNGLVASGLVDASGNVILTKRDGTTQNAGFAVQDVDLIAIANLTPANDDVIQRKSGVWTNRNLAQLRTDLGTLPVAGTTGQILAKNSATNYDAGWIAQPGLWQAFTPVLRRADTKAVLTSSAPLGRYTRIGNTVLYYGQITSTNATAGGACVDVPVAANWRPLECGLMLCTTLTAVDATVMFARMVDVGGAQIVLHNFQTSAFKDAAAGSTIYWNIQYEVQ